MYCSLLNTRCELSWYGFDLDLNAALVTCNFQLKKYRICPIQCITSFKDYNTESSWNEKDYQNLQQYHLEPMLGDI